MKTLIMISALAAAVLCGCTTTTTASDFVFLKTTIGPASCTAPVNGACASCETACPARNQALCVGGSSLVTTQGAAPSCIKPASCTCIGNAAEPAVAKPEGS
jgi:hypothetical protein